MISSKRAGSTERGSGRCFRKVVMPIGIPALASLAIFQFIWVWNDLLVALVFLSGQHPHHADDVPLRADPSSGQQLLGHLHRGDDLDRHPA